MLQYHIGLTQGGVHLSLEELYEAMDSMGFELIKEEMPGKCMYTPQSQQEMLHVSYYQPVLFVTKLRE